MRWCEARWPLCENILGHSVHLYGLSPVWVRMCITKMLLNENPFGQCVHLKSFPPKWVRVIVVTLLSSEFEQVSSELASPETEDCPLVLSTIDFLLKDLRDLRFPSFVTDESTAVATSSEISVEGLLSATGGLP